MLHQLTVRQKLLSGFALLILLLCAVVLIAYSKLVTIQNNVSEIKEDRYPKIVLSNRLSLNLLQIGREVRDGVLARDPQAIERHIRNVDAIRAANQADLDKMEPLLGQPEAARCSPRSAMPKTSNAHCSNRCTR